MQLQSMCNVRIDSWMGLHAACGGYQVRDIIGTSTPVCYCTQTSPFAQRYTVLKPDLSELFDLVWLCAMIEWIIMIEYCRPRFNPCPLVDGTQLCYSVQLKSAAKPVRLWLYSYCSSFPISIFEITFSKKLSSTRGAG